MQVNQLATLAHPDFNDIVVHFTGRAGPSNRSHEIVQLSDRQRLGWILVESRLRTFTMFGTGERATCFTESTRQGIAWLLATQRYTPCGIAFSKQTVFERGGGPALYVRGDEWDAIQSFPPTLRARATRLWPGAVPASGESLPHNLLVRSEWLEEREWRALPDNTGHWTFTRAEIAFLIVPDAGWFDALCVASGAPPVADEVRGMSHVIFGDDGNVISSVGVHLKDP